MITFQHTMLLSSLLSWFLWHQRSRMSQDDKSWAKAMHRPPPYCAGADAWGTEAVRRCMPWGREQGLSEAVEAEWRLIVTTGAATLNERDKKTRPLELLSSEVVGATLHPGACPKCPLLLSLLPLYSYMNPPILGERGKVSDPGNCRACFTKEFK